MNRSATVRPFGIRDKVGYLFGDFGNDFTFIFSTMMLMKFYTDVMGVSAGVVGLVMTIARIVDAFTDVTIAHKLGQAASAGLTGLLLELIGYTASTRTNPVVQEGLFNISVLVPALGFALLAAILWFWYPLHKKQVEENVQALKEKHAAEA